jgi:hypothetical protein
MINLVFDDIPRIYRAISEDQLRRVQVMDQSGQGQRERDQIFTGTYIEVVIRASLSEKRNGDDNNRDLQSDRPK